MSYSVAQWPTVALLWTLTASSVAAGPAALSGRLSQAREVRVLRLATRLDQPAQWKADSVARWSRRTVIREAELTTRQRGLLAQALSDSVVPRAPLWHRSELVDAEDCDFLLVVRSSGGTSTVLLSFPESEARWLDPDSALTVVRFEGHAQRAIEVLRECFRTDSTVQDLPAAVGWFLHNPVMTGIECNGVIPFYEGVPRLVVEVGCEYPDVEHAPSGSFTVWIETVIDRNGDVRLARVKQVGTRPIPMLEEGALACVRRRRYHPASFEGHPFGFRLTVPVTYKFE